MADRHDRARKTSDRLDERCRGATRCEPAIHEQLRPEAVGDRFARLPRTEERAGENRCWEVVPGRERLGERECLCEPSSRERSRLVRLSGDGFCVAADVDVHRGPRIDAVAGMNRGMPTLRYVICDVFTDRPLTGNQLAVFTDGREADDSLMQSLALEVGFSETVFVLPAVRGGTARIRIFTPHEELPFAGHPTLGTAFVLAAPLSLGVIELETGVGTVPVSLERDSSGRIVFGRMRQPVPAVTPAADPAAVLAAVGATRSVLPVELYDNGVLHLVVTLGSPEEVAALRPDREAVAALGVTGVNCVAPAGDRWRTRMFWAHGEDAATGSAAGPIACHLARHEQIPWGEEIVLDQGLELGRPSRLHARADGADGLIEAVEVGGAAVIVARGEFRL